MITGLSAVLDLMDAGPLQSGHRQQSEISELHVGPNRTMNALSLKDFAGMTHRGLRGPGSIEEIAAFTGL